MDVFLTGFPKKLLVAISLVVLIAMFITPTEARTLERRRHKRVEGMAQTKDTSRLSMAHRGRHQKRLENLTLPTRRDAKEPRRPKNAKIYVRETRKILRKVKNTMSFFRDDQQQLRLRQELKKYRETVPSWLPTVNFVDIHYNSALHYNNGNAKRNGSSAPERKFKFLMPKLYKSLVEYEELFKRFQNVELNFPDDPFNAYKNKRNEVLQKTLLKLYSTIQEVNDSMTAVNMTIPQFKNKLDLSKLEMKVDATQCLRNDFLLFRGYGNLLKNWYSEFRCPKNGKNTSQRKICKDFEEMLKERKDSRKDRNVRTRSRATT
ncbi:uncharacterized protein LOC126371503 isoform X2 [Pectinophora gossypiella]|uniref:uncharacterized protein LOC126371503 isoform X2 n=1 Tax=Pectinophora gossypiella TaxID=13191 RepID=UPI00214F443E|nr:uncharacterized protein LOC126371503 isoform X2 [Pectinophora gossypiella]